MRDGYRQMIRLYFLIVAVAIMIPGGTFHAESLSYTDVEGNVFCYETDTDGTAVITSITASGGNLLVPDEIEGIKVARVENGENCVISNPERVIPRLEINCGTVGTKAFSHLTIGTLVVGEKVSCFSLSRSGTVALTYGQFASSMIDRVLYQAVDVSVEVPSSNISPSVCGPFYQAQVGALEFDTQVSVIPANLFRDAVMELDTLEIQAESIGAYAFSGSSIFIRHLVLGEKVKKLLEFPGGPSGYHYWCQFSQTSVGTLSFDSLSMETEHGQGRSYINYAYGAFYQAKIGELEIGAGVQKIPEYFLNQASLTQEKLSIDIPEIGAYGLSGANISIGTLTIGADVLTFPESYYSDESYHYWNQFAGCRIEKLVYGAVAASVVNDKYGMGYGSIYFQGPFRNAEITSFSVEENVSCIPDYLLYEAKAHADELDLNMPVIGAMAFMGENITIDSLTIGEGVEAFSESAASSSSSLFLKQFSEAAIKNLSYHAVNPDMGLDSWDGFYFYGPFYQAAVTNLTIGEEVVYLDRRMFAGNSFENCEVFAVKASESFLTQSLSEGNLPSCSSLSIHYHSDFKKYFAAKAESIRWLCLDYLDTTYGNTMQNGETGEEEIEVLKTCRICGYEESSVEPLDVTYDIHLSLPVEISLGFQQEEKAFVGTEEIFAFGSLGNAYQGIRICPAKEDSSYGLAALGEQQMDFSSYLTVGFPVGEEVMFSAAELSENQKLWNQNRAEEISKTIMRVSVSGNAFLLYGEGTYHISIPIRVELVHRFRNNST